MTTHIEDEFNRIIKKNNLTFDKDSKLLIKTFFLAGIQFVIQKEIKINQKYPANQDFKKLVKLQQKFKIEIRHELIEQYKKEGIEDNGKNTTTKN